MFGYSQHTYLQDIVPLQDKLFSAVGALSMQCTIAECGEDFWLNNAYLNFPPKHPFMWQLMNAFALEFNGKAMSFSRRFPHIHNTRQRLTYASTSILYITSCMLVIKSVALHDVMIIHSAVC